MVYTVSCRFNKLLQPVLTLLANNTEHELRCRPTIAQRRLGSGVNRQSSCLPCFFVFTHTHTLSWKTAVSQSSVTCSRLPRSASCMLPSKQDPEIWAKVVRVFDYVREVSWDVRLISLFWRENWQMVQKQTEQPTNLLHFKYFLCEASF